MKIIKTALYQKLSKKKEWDPNPWAVCHTTVDKDENPEKYERCVKKVKKKQAQQEVSFQQIFDRALQMYNGDKRKAAEAVLDLATTGTWAVWDQEKIDNGIQTILKQFGNQTIQASSESDRYCEKCGKRDTEQHGDTCICGGKIVTDETDYDKYSKQGTAVKIIKSKKYANTFEGYDPLKVDFTNEGEKAKQMDTMSLLGALSDAIEASQVSVNQGKYFDQASIYRQELKNRGFSFEEQDRQLATIPSLHTNPQI